MTISMASIASLDPAKTVILVIDDDPASLALIDVILRRQRFAPVMARNTEEGMLMIQSHHPDVIILDDVMPNQYGGEFCRQLKQDPIYGQIPVIMLSAGMRVRDPSYLQQTRADGALLKPFLPKELVSAIENVLHYTLNV